MKIFKIGIMAIIQDIDSGISLKIFVRIVFLFLAGYFSYLSIYYVLLNIIPIEQVEFYLKLLGEYYFILILTIPTLTVLWVLRTYDRLMDQKIARESINNQTLLNHKVYRGHPETD